MRESFILWQCLPSFSLFEWQFEAVGGYSPFNHKWYIVVVESAPSNPELTTWWQQCMPHSARPTGVTTAVASWVTRNGDKSDKEITKKLQRNYISSSLIHLCCIPNLKPSWRKIWRRTQLIISHASLIKQWQLGVSKGRCCLGRMKGVQPFLSSTPYMEMDILQYTYVHIHVYI